MVCAKSSSSVRSAAALGLVYIAACGPGSASSSGLSGGGDPLIDSTTTTSSDATSTNGSTSLATTSSGSDVSTSSSMSSTGEPVVDVGLPTTGDSGSTCNGKIDIMFLISGGEVLQEGLEASIPEFAATMQEVLGEFDLHVMVVDPDGRWGSNLCPKDKCPADGGCPLEGYDDFPCWALHEEGALTKCDNTRGAGVVFQAGPYAANKPCGVEPGQRYITSNTPDFAGEFACLAHDGGAPGGELMYGNTLGRALAFDLTNGCNAGFLREDALLMVVQIVVASWEEPTYWDWADYVLEAKSWDQDMAVALAISSDWAGYEDGPLCEGADAVPHPPAFAAWTQEFEHGVHGSKCAPTYAPFFAEAAAIAAELCDPAPN